MQYIKDIVCFCVYVHYFGISMNF